MAALDHAYVDGRFLDPGKFITPDDPAVQQVAASIVNKVGDDPSSRLSAAYNYVAANIKYVTDKAQYGYPEVWAMPDETLKRGLGDCEDTSFLLCSLLLALGIDAKVVFGVYEGQGHAWVEAYFDSTGGILETTTGQPFTGFADPSLYSGEQVVAGPGLPEDPLVAFLVYLAPGFICFGIGAFLMIDDAGDAFKFELSTYGEKPGKHGILRGVAMPGLPPHIHHWLLGFILVILGIILLAIGVVLWMLKYL